MNIKIVIVECIGWIGALLVLTAFYLISTNKVDSSKPVFHWLNIFGAIGLIIHTLFNAAYPSAFVNIIWVGVAIYSLARLKR
ncbi:MAG: CBU_0592 family membrane protein [Cytophaga sp.]|uniref:CBU_0592 family membrane protein n=1 Tax=Cytophaga sp. TaxID=29535 RepID=UPI003F7D4282